MSYYLTPEAREDLREAFLYYESQRVGLGMELAIEVGIGWESSRMRLDAGHSSKLECISTESIDSRMGFFIVSPDTTALK